MIKVICLTFETTISKTVVITFIKKHFHVSAWEWTPWEDIERKPKHLRLSSSIENLYIQCYMMCIYPETRNWINYRRYYNITIWHFPPCVWFNIYCKIYYNTEEMNCFFWIMLKLVTIQHIFTPCTIIQHSIHNITRHIF